MTRNDLLILASRAARNGFAHGAHLAVHPRDFVRLRREAIAISSYGQWPEIALWRRSKALTYRSPCGDVRVAPDWTLARGSAEFTPLRPRDELWRLHA